MRVTDHLAELVVSALEKLPDGPQVTPHFERPKRKEHGDWASNVALAASPRGTNPRELAQAIIENLPPSEMVDKVEIAGPGFLNFRLSDGYFHEVVQRAADPESRFGRVIEGQTMRVNVEYVSSNPTGPVNVVSGRHAAVGDAIANLLEATGHEVTREFYANDAGRQIRLFGTSLGARYLQLHGREAELPDDAYQGEYIKDLAATLAQELGDSLVDAEPEEREKVLARAGIDLMLEQARATLERFGTRFDVWFRESTLHERGEIIRQLDRLRASGYVYDKDGAVWFRSSEFGDDKDRVLIRADGESTYLASDVPYLEDKFTRGFDHLIYLWGADHHGTVARLLAAAQALGHDREKVEVRITQIVTLMQRGEALKASKRAGVIVPLDELVSDVGADAARYTFLTRSMDSPLEFDVEAVKEQAPENPVYYVQYAHARISAILRKALAEGVTERPDPDLSLLAHNSEQDVMRKLADYEFTVPEAAVQRAPQKMCTYVEELAAEFSAFYRDCKVVTEDAQLTSARLLLCRATKRVIADALGLLGVSAPERM